MRLSRCVQLMANFVNDHGAGDGPGWDHLIGANERRRGEHGDYGPRQSCSWLATRPGGTVDAGRDGRQGDYALLGDGATAPLAREVATRPHTPFGMVYGSKIAACGGEQALSLCPLEPDRRTLWIVFIVMGGEPGRVGDRVDLLAQRLGSLPGVGPQLGQGVKNSLVIHSIELALTSNHRGSQRHPWPSFIGPSTIVSGHVVERPDQHRLPATA